MGVLTREVKEVEMAGMQDLQVAEVVTGTEVPMNIRKTRML